MSTPIIHVRKQGRVATVFVDAATGRTLPMASFEDEPLGGFPMTCSIDELPSKFPGCRFQYWEEQHAPNPEAPPTNEAEFQRALRDAGQASAPAPAASKHSTQENVDQLTMLHQHVITKLQHMFSAWALAKGKKKAELGSEITAVGNFLCELFPDYIHVLKDLKEKAESPSLSTERKFSL
jgi:hypothetical protein